jgi:hypothetical protein
MPLSDDTDVLAWQLSYHTFGLTEAGEETDMRNGLTSFLYSTFLLSSAVVLFLMVSASAISAQTTETESRQTEVAKASPQGTATTEATGNVPVFTNYRGVQIGMSAEEVREKLDQLKDGGPTQDFFVFSKEESAQIYYDKDRKVMAISVDYFGGDANAPSPSTVIGEALQAKPDGSIYQLKRYPDAGYWVSYNRTAGDKPIVTITMQRI